MDNPHNAPGHPRARLFLRLAIGFAVIYGVWAAALSYRVVVRQQAVRRHFWFALRTRPRGAFSDHKTALRVAKQWVSALNAVYPANPCRPGPAFLLAEGTTHEAPRACSVIVSASQHHIHVYGYDTQGHRMDNVFQRLHPPPRHL